MRILFAEIAGASKRLGYVVLLCAAFTLGLAPLFPPTPARADSGSDTPAKEDLFAELLASEGDGAWRGVLNRILQEKDASWIGQELGRLFRDRVSLAKYAPCAAYCAAYLADHPQNGQVLLGSAIVMRAYGDDGFVTALRKHLTRGEGGWGRLLGDARTLLAQPDAMSRRAGIWFLAREDGAQQNTVRKELLAAARGDLDHTATPLDNPEGLQREYLDAFARLLGYRFSSLDEAVKSLTALQDLDLAHVILALSLKKDAPDSPLHVMLLDYAKRLIDISVAAKKPEGLEEFIDPDRTALPAIRRYAMQRAAAMGAEPTAVWGRILRVTLARETDAEVLRGALGILERTGFAEAAAEAPQLATALVVRLLQRGPGSSGADATEDRIRMARLLGTLRRRPPELDTLFAGEDSLEDGVLAELVRALGNMENVGVDDLLAHWRDHASLSGRDVAVRTAVVDALGRRGTRGTSADTKRAAAALREILTGVGDLGVARATNTDVRVHAIRSLGGYPGSMSSEVLGAIATGEDKDEAHTALVVLRKMAPADPAAVEVLAAVAKSEKLSSERRALAVESLGDLAKAAPEVLAIAREAVRSALAESAPADVRAAAAAAAVELKDADACTPLLAWARADASADRMGTFRALLQAVAGAGAGGDARIGEALETLGREDSWTAADALARELVQSYPRPVLELAHARILYAESGDEKQEADGRRKEVAEAAKILEGLVGPDPRGDAAKALPLYVQALERVGELAADPAARKTAWLEAARRALQSEDKPTLGVGLSVVNRLREPPLAALLTEEEAKRVDDLREQLSKRQ